MVPIGMFEKVMPLDVMPTFLLRALVVDDVERAEALGALELVERPFLVLIREPGQGRLRRGPSPQPHRHLEGRLMKALRKLLDSQAHLFEKGGKFEKFEALYEAPDTLLFTPGHVTQGDVHVRDGLDLKRMMITVVAALLPCVVMAFYNTGFQANLAISQGATPIDAWQIDLLLILMGGADAAFDPSSVVANLAHGAVWFVPVFAVTGIVGGHIEALFSVVRNHEINEGFLVTMFPVPARTPAHHPAVAGGARHRVCCCPR